MIIFILFAILGADVIELKDDTWDEVVKAEDPWIVGFFAPWCGHCKRFKPTFEEASNDERSKPVQFGKVDATTHTGLAQRYDVHSYPTILFIHNGHKYRFRRERTVDGIVDYLNEMTSDPLSTLTSAVEVKPFEVIYVLIKGDEDSTGYFGDIARKYLDQAHVKFYTTDDKDLCPSVQGAPQSNYVLRLEKSSEESFTTSLDKESLDSFIEKSNTPLVREVKGYMQFRPISKSSPYFFMLILNDETEIDQYFDSVHATASESDLDVFTFGLLHYSSLQDLLVRQLKLKNEDMPKFVVYHEVSTSFVVRDLNQNETNFGANAVIEEVLNGDPDWVYALPFTDRARRYIGRQIDQYGLWGQIIFVVLIFSVFFGLCFCLDAYCFPEPTEEELLQMRRERLAKRKAAQEAAKDAAKEESETEEPKKEK